MVTKTILLSVYSFVGWQLGQSSAGWFFCCSQLELTCASLASWQVDLRETSTWMVVFALCAFITSWCQSVFAGANKGPKDIKIGKASESNHFPTSICIFFFFFWLVLSYWPKQIPWKNPEGGREGEGEGDRHRDRDRKTERNREIWERYCVLCCVCLCLCVHREGWGGVCVMSVLIIKLSLTEYREV